MDHDTKQPHSTNPEDEPDPKTADYSTAATVLALLLLPLLAAGAAASAKVEPSRAEPGPEAAAAYELCETEKTRRAGCEAFLDQLTEGTADPWAFRGAVLCAAEVRGFRRRTLATLDRLPQDSALVLFARGGLHVENQEYETAEQLLRQAVAREPELALAWSTLGFAIRRRGDAAAAIPHIEEALRLAPELVPVQQELLQARLYAGVFDRLLDRLAAIPERWESIGESLIPISGKHPYEIYVTASEEEKNPRALGLIAALTAIPIEYRAAFINAWLRVFQPTEVDLWRPADLIAEKQTTNVVEAALAIEAWLQWAEALGRRDALFYAAGWGLETAYDQSDVASVLRIARSWAELPASPGTRLGRARVALAYAQLLSHGGNLKSSLAAYRKAGILYQATGDRRGQAASWFGVAEVLSHLGNNQDALTAYRKARAIFQSEDTPVNVAYTLAGEADVLFRFGDNEGALAAYRKARALYRKEDDRLGQGHTWNDEADVLFHLGDNEGALAAHRKARSLYEAVGARMGEGNTWTGEGDVLFYLGDIEGALAAHRKARALFEAVGVWLNEANTWIGEGDILFRLGDNQGALAAYRKARSLYHEVTDRLGEGRSWRGEAEVLLFLNDITGSLAASRKARSLAEAVGDRTGEGNSWLTEGDVLLRRGENMPSLAAFRRARSFFQGIADKSGEGWSWRGEAEVLFWLGRTEESLATYRKARALFAAVDDKFGKAKTWQGEGELLIWIGDHEEALVAFREARSLFQAVGDKAGEGSSWRGEAAALRYLGHNQDSLAACRRARVLARTGGDKIGEATAWSDEALALHLPGRYEQALHACRTARVLFQVVGDQNGQGDTWFSEGRTLSTLQEDERSLNAYRKARALYNEVGEKLGQGNTWLGEGEVLWRQAEYESSLAAYHEARTLYQATGEKRSEGNSWVAEADLRLDLGEYEQSLKMYRQARSLYQAVGDRLGEGNTLSGEARVLWRQGDYQSAAAQAAAAVRCFERSGVIPNRINALLVETSATSMLRQPGKAMTLALEGIRLHEDWRQRFITDRHRTPVDQQVYSAYDILISILSTRPAQAAEALTYTEKARSRVLLDLLATGPGYGEDRLSLNLARERLQGRLEEIEHALKEAGSTEIMEELLARQQQLEQKLDWNVYEQRAAGRRLAVAEPLDSTGIQAVASDNGPILIYYAVADKVIGFVVLPDQIEIQVEQIEISWADLKENVGILVYHLANPIREPQSRSPARQLWNQLIDPFVRHLPPGGRLTIIPHGPFHQVPFEALLDSEGHRLFERWNVSIAPSASALAFARRRHRPAADADAFVAFASGRGLKRPSAEVAEIARFFGEQQVVLELTNANYHNYKTIASRSRQLVIASRGVHVSGDHSRHGTYLEIRATSGAHDSRLTAAEIAGIPIEAELVTLAACDTAAGEALLSDERLDLSRAFLIAGAAAVLATRWKVPEDVATSRFLIDFYRAYRRGGPQGRGMRKDEALTLARRLSRERGDPAVIWAAWVLIGDPR